jgi:hypothetical protein
MFLRDPASERVTNTHLYGGMASMKLGLKALVIALVMALAAVPAAFAGNGHGGGQGKPSWAGQGKPSWAGSGHANGKAHHEQKEKKAKKPKHHQGDSAAEEDSADEVDLEGLNPAWYCKTLSDEMTKLERDFATMFGTNPNNANAFGKCVSRRAHGEDLSDAVGGDDEQDSCDTAEPPATEGTESGVEGDGTDTTASDDEATSDDEAVADDEAADDESSDDEASDSEECESDDSDSEEPADEEQAQGDDEQGEDDQGQDEDDVSGELDSSDLAAALRFLRL